MKPTERGAVEEKEEEEDDDNDFDVPAARVASGPAPVFCLGDDDDDKDDGVDDDEPGDRGG